MRRVFALSLLIILHGTGGARASCAQNKTEACSLCNGSVLASACACTCGLSPGEQLAYALVIFPALLMLLLYV